MAETKTKKELTAEREAAEREAAEREAKHRAEIKKRNEEKVPVFIRRPEGEPEESITVTLNGRNYQIAYDETVMVPRKIARIVEEMQRNDAKARRKMSEREGMKPLS